MWVCIWALVISYYQILQLFSHRVLFFCPVRLIRPVLRKQEILVDLIPLEHNHLLLFSSSEYWSRMSRGDTADQQAHAAEGREHTVMSLTRTDISLGWCAFVPVPGVLIHFHVPHKIQKMARMVSQQHIMFYVIHILFVSSYFFILPTN